MLTDQLIVKFMFKPDKHRKYQTSYYILSPVWQRTNNFHSQSQQKWLLAAIARISNKR